VAERPGGDASACDERGTALLLAPAGMLILLVLAALSFDLALAFQAKRQLVELAEAAANDAVTAGLDDGRFRAAGTYCLDPTRVARSVAATIGAGSAEVRVVAIDVPAAPGDCATGTAVTLEARSPYPFGRAVPGMPDGVVLRATGRATAVVR
jgi:Flp pilus assembly protein TadG